MPAARVRNDVPVTDQAPPGPAGLAEVRWALVATGLFALGLVSWLAALPGWLYWGCYLTCYGAGGWQPGVAGLRALRNRTLDVDLLMVVAALGAAAIGQIFDGAMLIVIFATSGALEAVATRRTEDSVRGLLDLAPETATRINEFDVEQRVDTAQLAVDDVLLIRPGERIGGDGVVLMGASEVDQATITGESLPAEKAPGDEVFAGTVNGTGTLRIRVIRPSADAVVNRIAAMVAEAGASKARTQQFIEKVEQRYSMLMVATTVALLVAPLLAGSDLRSSLLRAMTFMIVASPCALVLSTMPPLLAAIANASRHGVLVKSAIVLEKLAGVNRVAFDKTGTLTKGTPRLAEVHAETGFSDIALLSLAASAANPSEHPLARAIVAAARAADAVVRPATEFTSAPGQGVRARVGDHTVQVGSPRLLSPCSSAERFERAGYTAVAVIVDGAPAGAFGLTDQRRDGAREAVAKLELITRRTPLLVTGDNRRAAARLAGDVGIADVRAGLLPEDKVGVVRALEAEGGRILFVGDGVNDAPAMAAAHAAVAMGRCGSALALETSDAVITSDDLAALPAVVALARRARRVVTANLVIAAAFIVLLVTWDLLGHLPLPLGVAGHEGSTVLVGLNGLRLLRDRAWPGRARSQARTRNPRGSDCAGRCIPRR